MGFVRAEKRGPTGTEYYYLCSYDRRTKNIHKQYLGPVHSGEVQRTANFLMWLNTLDEKKVKKLKDECDAAERLGPCYHTSLERVLELGRLTRQS